MFPTRSSQSNISIKIIMQQYTKSHRKMSIVSLEKRACLRSEKVTSKQKFEGGAGKRRAKVEV
jgi:hypothetical protein